MVDRVKPLSEYRAMWLFAMFDLPVTTDASRKRATKFRKMLLSEGFSMLQFSVYARHCPSEDSASAMRNRLRQDLPPDGQVRLLTVTDRQFGKMEIYHGKTREPVEPVPHQLLLF